jgi:hypothetical protein
MTCRHLADPAPWCLYLREGVELKLRRAAGSIGLPFKVRMSRDGTMHKMPRFLKRSTEKGNAEVASVLCQKLDRFREGNKVW